MKFKYRRRGDNTKRKMKIGKNSPYQMYMPKDLADDGFVGDAVMLGNAVTATIVRDGVPIDDIISSLDLIIGDLQLRKRRGEELFKPSEGDETDGETVA